MYFRERFFCLISNGRTSINPARRFNLPKTKYLAIRELKGIKTSCVCIQYLQLWEQSETRKKLYKMVDTLYEQVHSVSDNSVLKLTFFLRKL